MLFIKFIYVYDWLIVTCVSLFHSSSNIYMYIWRTYAFKETNILVYWKLLIKRSHFLFACVSFYVLYSYLHTLHTHMTTTILHTISELCNKCNFYFYTQTPLLVSTVPFMFQQKNKQLQQNAYDLGSWVHPGEYASSGRYQTNYSALSLVYMYLRNI